MKSSVHKITTPLDDNVIAKLHAGDRVSISGIIYTARDAAHQRFAEAIANDQPLPFDLKNQVIFYVGPTPAKPGFPIGSAGPTTATRMDPFTPALIERGLKGMIGKGMRSQAVKDHIVKYKSVFFGGIEGTSALLSHTIKKAEIVAYEDLGTEAVLRLLVEDFPVFVVNDIYGKDLYQMGRERYRRR